MLFQAFPNIMLLEKILPFGSDTYKRILIYAKGLLIQNVKNLYFLYKNYVLTIN